MAATEIKKPITEEQQQELDAGLRACAQSPRDHRDLRSSTRRSPLPGGCLGRRQQADVHAAGRHGHQGERLGRCCQPHGQANEDSRRVARRASPEERRHHRGAAGEGHRQVRQAGRHSRLHRPHDEPGPHPCRQCDLRDQGARRGHLLTASAVKEDVFRNGAPDARSAGAGRRARRHPAMPDQGQHSDVAGADGAGRSDRSYRRPANGSRRVQLGHAGVRRRRRQLDDDHRRDREPRGSRAQHSPVQDIGFRLGLLGRWQPDHRSVDLRQVPGTTTEGGRIPRQRPGKGAAAPCHVGRRAAPHGGHGGHRAAAAGQGGRLHDPRRSQVHHRAWRRHRQGASVLRREADHAARPIQVQGLRSGARR